MSRSERYREGGERMRQKWGKLGLYRGGRDREGERDGQKGGERYRGWVEKCEGGMEGKGGWGDITLTDFKSCMNQCKH